MTRDSWANVLKLAGQFEKLTVALGERLVEDKVEELPELLAAREQVMVQFDSYKKQLGRSSWLHELATIEEPEIMAIKDQIKTILSQVMLKNEQIQREMVRKRASIEKTLAGLRRQRQVSRAYDPTGLVADGIFIDWKR